MVLWYYIAKTRLQTKSGPPLKPARLLAGLGAGSLVNHQLTPAFRTPSKAA